MEAKKKAPRIEKALEDWLNEAIPLPPSSNGKKPLDRIVSGEADFLLRATDEALAYLFWLARFVEGQPERSNTLQGAGRRV